MTIDEYNKYYKGLTFTSTTSLSGNVYTLGDLNEDGNLIIHWTNSENNGFNKTKIDLDDLEVSIRINRWVISKKDIKKRKIQLLKNDI